MLLFSYDYSYLPFFTPIGSRVTNPKHIVDTLVANINDLRRKYHTDELQYLMSIGMDRKIYLRGINNRLDQPTITNKVFDLEPSLLELLFFLQNEEKYTITAYIWAYSTGKTDHASSTTLLNIFKQRKCQIFDQRFMQK